MAVEYNAIALGLAALMFFLLDFARTLNFQTLGKGFIDINDIAKTILVFCSFTMGIGLVLFMYGAATGNTVVIEAVLLVALRFWVVLTTLITLMFVIYYFVIIPRLAGIANK